MEFVEINKIEEYKYTGEVYDLSIEKDESYNIEGIIVHNSACTTSANGGVHYPMASLVKECHKLRRNYPNTKIVADGGFKNFSDIIKGLAIGADYIMLGSILNKCLESCSDNYILDNNTYNIIDTISANEKFRNGEDIFKYYRGMSTKEVQKKWGRKELKTAEGISMYNKVEYTLKGWTDNFTDYLKTNMSYCNKRNMDEYRGQVEYVFISQNAFNRYNK